MSVGAQLGLSWRVIFFIGGLAPIVIALLMMRLLPGSGRQATAGERSGAPQIESVACVAVWFGSRDNHIASVGGILFYSAGAATSCSIGCPA